MKLNPKILDHLRGFTTHWRGFANLEEVARYEWLSQTIFSDKFESTNLAACKTSHLASLRVLSVMAHEYAHWVDHVASVWGQRNLYDLYNALNARRANLESEMWRVARLKAATNAIDFANYYTVIHEPTSIKPGAALILEYTSGIQYDAAGKPDEGRPIAFGRFYRQSLPMVPAIPVARTPVTILALTEAHAVSCEIACQLKILETVSETERTAQLEGIRARLMSTLSDPKLMIYNVCAHAVANKMGLFDPFEAYRRTGVLARICLNVTERDFSGLRVPSSFNTWGSRNESFKHRRDRGYLFLCLLAHGEKFDASNFDTWLEKTLAAANLNTIQHIEQQAAETIPKISQSHYAGWATSRYQRLTTLGTSQFPTIGLLNSASVIADNVLGRTSNLHLPPVVLGDGDLWSPSTFDETVADVEDWVFSIRDIDPEIREFLSACSA